MPDDKLSLRDTSIPQISELERVHKELARWRGRAFLLTPYARTTFDSIKGGFRPEFRTTYISPDKADWQVYELDGQPDKLVLSKIGLQLLDHLAGIEWMGTFNALEDTDPKDPHFCKKKAVGKIQDLDGVKRNSVCTATLDLMEGSDLSKKMVRIDKQGNPDYRQLNRARMNIVSQTETLAKNKVRRELLGLQPVFTRKELTDKPFVILKLSPIQDMNDPLVRKLTIMQQFSITSELYDQVAANLPDPAEISGPYLPSQDIVIDAKAEEVKTDVQPNPSTRSLLITHIEAMYNRKVKGGRSPQKPPLTSLSDEELNKLESFLIGKPDIA